MEANANLVIEELRAILSETILKLAVAGAIITDLRKQLENKKELTTTSEGN